MDIPIINQTAVIKKSKSNYSKSQEHIKSFVKLGKPPAVNIKPKIKNILDHANYETNKEKNILASGTSNRHFSSQQVFPVSLNEIYSYSTVGKLFFTDEDNINRTCTASVIGKRIVVTAGHCVYPGNSKRQNTNFYFIPGYLDGSSWSGNTFPNKFLINFYMHLIFFWRKIIIS